MAWAGGAVVAAAVCVAGSHIDLHFCGRRGLRGRSGTYGTGRALVACLVHVAPLSPRQAWHLVTSTFTLRGRRGTWSHRPSLCVAGVALGDIDLHFAWQA